MLLSMSLLSARMKKIQSKMNALLCPQHFSQYKSMGIFQDTQGQLSPQSLIGSGQNSNLSEMLWFKNEEDPIKNKGTRVATRFSPL